MSDTRRHISRTISELTRRRRIIGQKNNPTGFLSLFSLGVSPTQDPLTRSPLHLVPTGQQLIAETWEYSPSTNPRRVK
jgi:hypothetical protein